MIFKTRSQDEPRIELTSLVDVVFLLLIFFMISTTFIDSAGLDIRLPQSSSERPVDPPEAVKVSLQKDGQIFLGKEAITLSALKPRLEAAIEANRSTGFILSADKDALHGRVIAVMDAAKQAGFTQLAISARAAQPNEEETQ